MFKIYITALFVFVSSLYAHSEAAVKKNLCTITINSSEEADLFKSNLSEKDWNFIELAPNSQTEYDPNWFKMACRKKIQCDVLVVSGHFAGSFFGLGSKVRLPIDILESNSCDQDCDGIVNKPKEVFLFGCNTLATKEKDQRTPEQYMQVLLEDGFSATQASQIVSYRYSEFGESFKSRMSSVFAKSPLIYGFSSKGPSGKTIYPLLKSYLNTTKSEYANFDKYISKQKTAKNEKLFTALAHTALAQAVGSKLNMESVNEKPYCFIQNQSNSRLEKINFVEHLFKNGKAIDLLPHISRFIHETKSFTLSDKEKDALNRLSTDPKIKSDLLSILKINADVYIPLKVHILNTMRDLNIINNDFVEKVFSEILHLDKPMKKSMQEMLCSTSIDIDLPVRLIPEARFSEMNFLTAMACIKPKNSDFHNKVFQQLSLPDAAARGTAIWFFNNTTGTNLNIQSKLMQIFATDSEDSLRLLSAKVLSTMNIKDQTIQSEWVNALLQQSDEILLNSGLRIFNKNQLTAKTIIELKNKAVSSNFKNQIFNYLK